ANRVADDVAGIARSRGARAAAKVPSPAGAKSSVGATSGAAASTAAAARPAAAWPAAARSRFSHRRSALRATQSGASFAHEGAISDERLVHRFVRLINPPGKERVVAVVITVPRPQRAAQAVDRCGCAIGDRSFDPALLASQPGFNRAARRFDLFVQVVERGG